MVDEKAVPVKNKFPCKLRWLDLSDNNLSDDGFAALLQAWSTVPEVIRVIWDIRFWPHAVLHVPKYDILRWLFVCVCFVRTFQV